MRPDCAAVQNDPRGAAARRRPTCPLCSRCPQHPCASTEPAHGLGRGRGAENGSVDWRPAALRGAVPRRCTGLGRAAPEAGEGQQAGGRRGFISASFSVIFERDDEPLTRTSSRTRSGGGGVDREVSERPRHSRAALAAAAVAGRESSTFPGGIGQ